MTFPTLTELRQAAYAAPWTTSSGVQELPGYEGSIWYAKYSVRQSNGYVFFGLEFEGAGGGVTPALTVDDLDFFLGSTVYDVEIEAFDGSTDYFNWSAGDTTLYGSWGSDPALTEGIDVASVAISDFGPLNYTAADDQWHVDGLLGIPDGYVENTSLVFADRRKRGIRYGGWVTPADVVLTGDPPDGLSTGSGFESRWYSMSRTDISHTGDWTGLATDLTPSSWHTDEVVGAPEVAAYLAGHLYIRQLWVGVIIYFDERFQLTPVPPDEPGFIGWEFDSGTDTGLIGPTYFGVIDEMGVQVTTHLDRQRQAIGGGLYERYGGLSDNVDVYLEPPGYGTVYDDGLGQEVARPADSLANVDYDPPDGTDNAGNYFMVRDGLVDDLELLNSIPAADHLEVTVDIPSSAFAQLPIGVGPWLASIRLAPHRQVSLVAPTVTSAFPSVGDGYDLGAERDAGPPYFQYVTTWHPPRYRPVFAAPAVSPPLRQFPRDDTLGGAPRQGRVSRSVQASTRQGWTGAYR